MNECSYGKIPRVEDTLAGYISFGGVSSLKARYYPKSLFRLLRLGWVKHIRQQVRLEAVRTRWWCCRHIRLTCLKRWMREMILEMRILFLLLVWLSTEAVAFFTPRPPFFFPLLASFVSSHLLRDSLCTALQTRKLWIWSTGLLVQLTLSSQQEVWVLGNLFVLTGHSQPAIWGMRGRGGKSYVWRLFQWRTLKISTYSVPW